MEWRRGQLTTREIPAVKVLIASVTVDIKMETYRPDTGKAPGGDRFEVSVPDLPHRSFLV